MGDGFWFGVDEEFVGVAAASLAVESRAPLAEYFFEFFLGMGSKLLNGFDSEGAEGAFGDFANAGNFADRKRGEEACFHTGRNPDEAAGLALIGGDFGCEASRCETAGAGKARLFGDTAEKFVRGGERRAVEALGAGEVEVGFVDGNHLDDGREFGEDGGDAVAPFGIFFMVAVEENSMRAEAPRSAQGHGGVDAEFAGFVAGGGDDTALVWPAADDNGFATEIGAFEEFDRDEEGVHVHVEDGGHGGHYSVVGGVVFGAEACQIWHGVRVRLHGGGDNESDMTGGHARFVHELRLRTCR